MAKLRVARLCLEVQRYRICWIWRQVCRIGVLQNTVLDMIGCWMLVGLPEYSWLAGVIRWLILAACIMVWISARETVAVF